MTPEIAFQLANGAAPIAWVLMMAAPNSGLARRLVLSDAFIALLASAYALVILTHFNVTGADFTSLEGVTALLSDPWAMTAGLIHYLALDLLAGIMVTRKGLDLGIPRLWLLPCQLGCFMLGPVGILLFIGVSKARGNRWQDVGLN